MCTNFGAFIKKCTIGLVCCLTIRDDFENIVGMLTKSKNVHGSLAETFATNNFKLGTKFCRALLPSEDHCFVSALVYKLDPAASDQSKVCINSIFCKYSFVSLKGKVFCSSGKKSKPVVAMVKWEEDIYVYLLHQFSRLVFLILIVTSDQ